MVETNHSLSISKFSYSDFTDKKILGEGFFNQVYLVTHADVGRCAVKIVSRSFYGKDREKQRLEAEAAHLFSFKHEHILLGYGVVMEPAHLCLVYEHAEFGCLTDALRRILLTWPLKIRIAYEVALALCYLHGESVLHRNLKSSNVLLTKDFHVKVSDFVLPENTNWMTQATQHKSRTDRQKREAGGIVVKRGTCLAHIPPETVCDINAKPTLAYDMYSFGVIAWEMLTNKQPFAEYDTEQVYSMLSNGYLLPMDDLQPGYPIILQDIMQKAFNRNPQLRPTFPEARDQIRPHYDRFSTAALADSLECQARYERYRVAKRGRLASQPNGSRSKGGVTLSSTNEQDRAFIDSDLVQNKVISHNEAEASTPISTVVPSNSSISQPHWMKTTVKPVQEQTPCDDKEMNCDSFQKPFSSDLNILSKQRPSGNTPWSDEKNPDADKKPKIPAPADPLSDVNFNDRRIANFNIHGSNVNIQMGDGAMMNVGPSANEPSFGAPTAVELNTLPAIHSQRPLTQKDIFVVGDHVGKHWKRLARCMKLSEAQIDTIDHDYSSDGLFEKIYQTTRKWEQMCGGAVPVSKLVHVLYDATLIDVARRIQE